MGPLAKELGMGMMGKKPASKLGADEEEGEDYASPEEEAQEESSEVPPDFQAAYDEWEANPSAESLYRAIEACKGGSSVKPGGLELIFGGKGKK